MSISIRLMQVADLVAVADIQGDAYTGHFVESAEVIAQRFAVSSSTSWVAERDGRVCAYLVCYWSRVGKVSPLNMPFTRVDNADCLYFHDLALLNGVQGHGVATLLIKAASDYARKKSAIALALVSVQNSVNFWSKIGFSEYSLVDKEQRQNLRTYLVDDAPTLYMVKYF